MSKMAVAQAVQTVDAETTIKFLQGLMTTFGTPQELVTDRGSNFMAIATTEFLQKNQIKHLPTTPYHPQLNGECERFNGTSSRSLKKMVTEKRTEWDRELWRAVKSYNEATHTMREGEESWGREEPWERERGGGGGRSRG